MKSILTLAVAIALSAVAPAFGATSHDDASQAHHAKPKITLDHGRKWATDDALRQGMGAIRADLAAKLPAIRSGALRPAEYSALGASIESQVAYIVGNCKLTPEADANLHVIVAELVESADGLKSADAKLARKAALRAAKAANTYGKYFDHPQWTPLSPLAQTAIGMG